MQPVQVLDDETFAHWCWANARAAKSASAQLRVLVAQSAAAAAEWIQQAQSERGWSNRWLLAADAAARPELDRVRRAADAAWQRWLATIQALGATPSAAPWPALWCAVADMASWPAKLHALRTQVDRRNASWPLSTSRWTAAIADMLHVQGELGWILGEALEAAPLVLWLTLLRYKELCGQERAVGSALLGEPCLDDAQRQWLVVLVERQAELREILTRAAVVPPEAQEQLSAELHRLRRALIEGVPPPGLSTDRVQRWFDLCTRRINALHAVEQRLRPEVENAHCADAHAERAPALDAAAAANVEALRQLRERLADQRWIDRAKAHLIARGATEAQAHHQLRRLAMGRRLTFAQAARWVVLADGT